MKCKLHVASALNFEFFDDLQGAVVQHLQIRIVQTQNRRDDDGITCVYPDRIHVFHTADCDRVVVGIPHDFELNLFIALYTFLNQHLVNRGKSEGVRPDPHKFFLVLRKPAAGSAESESGPQHDRISDLFCCAFGLFKIIGDF